jgi:hypothetical protein
MREGAGHYREDHWGWAASHTCCFFLALLLEKAILHCSRVSQYSRKKTQFESLSSRLEQIEDRISGHEDKVYVLEHSDEDKEKVQMEHERPQGHH